MTRKELMISLMAIVLNLAIAIERIADNETDKGKARQLQARLDDWLALVVTITD